jgi:hypothetical protein
MVYIYEDNSWPLYGEESHFANYQEASQKDVELTFGMLQQCFASAKYPALKISYMGGHEQFCDHTQHDYRYYKIHQWLMTICLITKVLLPNLLMWRPSFLFSSSCIKKFLTTFILNFLK